MLAFLALLATPALAAPLAERAGGPINNMNITINPDPPTQCSNVHITWTNGDEPYVVKVGTGGYYVPNSTWLYEASDIYGDSWDWRVDQPVGTALNFQVWDKNNVTKNVQNVIVQPGNTCCIVAPPPST